MFIGQVGDWLASILTTLVTLMHYFPKVEAAILNNDKLLDAIGNKLVIFGLLVYWAYRIWYVHKLHKILDKTGENRDGENIKK